MRLTLVNLIKNTAWNHFKGAVKSTSLAWICFAGVSEQRSIIEYAPTCNIVWLGLALVDLDNSKS